MSSRLSAISLVAAALSLTACPPAVKVSIYNNTPDPITVVWLRGQALMIPSHSPLTLSFPPVLGSFSVVRRGVRLRLCHLLSRERVHVSELQIRVADSAECQYLRGAGHDASDSISIPTEWLSPCAARVMLPRQTSNRSMKPTAPDGMKASNLVTIPCRGLSLSR